MSPPKHLWSGDWQRESEAAARARAQRQPPVAAPSEEPEAARVAVARTSSPPEPARPPATRRHAEAPRPAKPPRPVEPPRRAEPARARSLADRGRAALAYMRSHLTVNRARARLAAIVAVVALLVVGGAYGLNALLGDSANSNQSSVANANAWLGLQMQSLANGSVVISSVVPGSPAASAGMKPGDVITEVESRPVVAPIDVTEAVAALQAGDTVELQLVRGSSTYNARVKLTARPASFP